MSRYILAPTAQKDLIAIQDYYLKRAGYRIARQMLVEFVKAFQAIAQNPGVGHTRKGLAKERPILFWRIRDYLIIYRTASRPVEIVVIARGSRDIAKIIRKRTI